MRRRRAWSRVLATAVVLFLLAPWASAQAIPPEKTTLWSGKMVLNRTYEVPKGYALKIAPGTAITMENGWRAKIVVRGVLEAVGTKEKPILFRAAKPGYWGGITFAGREAKGRIEHCRIENGRRASVHCSGASPVIRNCTITGSTYGGQGWIFCENGACPVIEGNTIGGTAAGVICDNSSPVIKRNTFKNCKVGIYLYGFKPESPRPTIAGNTGEDCSLLLLDETAEPGKMLSKSFESELIPRPLDLSVERDGKRHVVVAVLAGQRSQPGEKRRLVFRGGAFLFEPQTFEPKEFKPRRPALLPPLAGPDGKDYHVLAVTSGAGLMGRDGCEDTSASYVLLLSGEGGDAKLVWRSRKFSRGALRLALADLDGDGTNELVVGTGRWCEGKGQILVYRQTRAVNR